MEKVFTTSSAYLGIWNTLPETFRKAFNLKLKEELKLIKNISIEVETEEFYPIDDPKVQSFTAIVDKIISRGHPTYINKFYEDRVIKILEKNGFVFEDLKITTNGRNIGYRIKSLPPNFNHENELKIIHRLIFSKFNNSLTNHQITQSVNEEDAPIVGPSEDKFFEILGDSISHKLQSNILRQPLISDLIGQEIDPIINSKVDFALNFGDLKLVIEIDGGEHEFDEAVREHDEERKAILESNGWDLWRPKNEEIQKGALEWIKKIKNIEQDSIINEENELFLQKEMDSIAWLSLVHPHLVQRATKAINLIINHGKFPQGKNAKILIVEEDIPVIIEALYELYEIHENLKILSDDICDLPFLEIEYIGAGVRIKPPKSKYLSWKKVVKPQKKYDLILDHSFTLRSGQIGLMEEKLKLTTLNNFVRLRSDPTVSEDRKMLWANTINYNLQDLEKAILSLKTDDPLKIPKNKYGALRYFLKSIFRKDDYWDGQVMVISRLLLKKNTIVLLPTGGGKSLTYQIAGLLQPGVTIIIDPLVALISDQVENLNMMGFDRAGFISSLLERDERDTELEKVADGRYYYVFVAPERLQMQNFRNQLLELVNKYPISLAVIDEAHCVSEWGHDFRPSYLHLGRNLNKYCSNDKLHPPPIVGLTGTASFTVLTDIQVELNIHDQDAVILPETFERKEIKFLVQNVDRTEKAAYLRIIKNQIARDLKKNPQTFYNLKGEKTNCGIVFVPHASTSSDLGALRVANLSHHNNWYSGKADKQHKIKVQTAFKQNKIQEIVATKSFGMGIDKPNIMYTIHYTIPSSVEAFYQEAGRAGRTGITDSARSYVIYSHDNYELVKEIIYSKDHKAALKAINKVNWNSRGDLLNQLWLLFNSYLDRSDEKDHSFKLWVKEFYPAVSTLPIGGSNKVSIRFTYPYKSLSMDKYNINRSKLEKSIFRLVQLGIVKDYAVDWDHRSFDVNVINISVDEIRDHLKDFIIKYKLEEEAEEIIKDFKSFDIEDGVKNAISLAIDFVYDEIVLKRKNAIITLADLCNEFQDGRQFQESILNYLQESEFTPILKEWVNKPFNEIGITAIDKIVKSITEHEQTKRLVGTARRMLDEDPENIALRLLSFIARRRSNVESDDSVSREATTLFVNLIKDSYDLDKEDIFLLVFDELIKNRLSIFNKLLGELLPKWYSRNFIREMLEKYPNKINSEITQNLLSLLLSDSIKAVKNLEFYKSIR